MNAGMKTGQKTFITYECWYENWTKDLHNLWMLIWKLDKRPSKPMNAGMKTKIYVLNIIVPIDHKFQFH